MSDFWDETLTPKPPVGLADGVGQSPYPFNDLADVAPKAPSGASEYVGDSPYPCGPADVHPTVDTHNGEMPLHPRTPKPGSFGADHDGGNVG